MGSYFAASDQQLASALTTASTVMSSSLQRALANVTVMDPNSGKPFFVPPILSAARGPYHTLIESVEAEYSNFRYYTEALLALQLPADYALAILNFHQSRTGSVSGITRWSDHLDDMPAVGYGLAALYHGQLDFFHTLHYGHMANYHGPGTFHSTEQLGK